MLTEDEKSHLKAEETFRYEIRKSLEKKEKKTFPQKVWDVINSTFGLWLLSTVVVGLIVTYYNNSKMENEIANTRVETMRKLTTEVRSRLQMFKIALSQLPPDRFYKYSYMQLAYMVDGGDIIEQGNLSNEPPIYVFPEFRDRTLQSLLFEMEQLTDNNKGVDSIRNGRTVIGKIKNSLIAIKDFEYDMPPFSQRIQQLTQMSPYGKLSREDSTELERYKQHVKISNQQEEVYREKTKIFLDSLGNELLNDPFLKKASSD